MKQPVTAAERYQHLPPDHPAIVAWHEAKRKPAWGNFFMHSTGNRFNPDVIDDVYRGCHAAFVHAFLLGMQAAEE